MSRIRVLHSYYGCDSGCCGHVIELDGERVDGSFTFSHFDDMRDSEFREALPGEWERIAGALHEYVAKHVPPECLATIDWDTLEIESCI